MSKIGDLLLSQGLLSAAQWKTAESLRHSTGKPLDRILVEEQMVSVEELTATLAANCEMKIADPLAAPIPKELIKTLPLDLAQKCRAIPFAVSHKGKQRFVHVGIADPTDSETLELLRERFGRRFLPFVAAGDAIDQAIAAHYKPARPASPTPPKPLPSHDIYQELRAVTLLVKALRDLLIEKKLITAAELERKLNAKSEGF